MKIKTKDIAQLQAAVKILLIASLLLFALSTVVMIGFIVFQNILISSVIGYFPEPQFIFPFFEFFQQIFFFGLLILFSYLLMQKSKEQNGSIAFELLALILVFVITSLVSPLLSNWFTMLNSNNEAEYIIWYSGLSRFLYFARFGVPISFILYYIATTIQLVLKKLNPQEETIF